MSDLLNAALEATSARRAEIVSEQHDVGKIKVEESAIQSALRGLAGGRAWDAAEYGITAEQAAAQIAAADTPEARERVMADLRQRAIRRAGLDVSNGRVSVMVAGTPPWHGLGVNVRNAVDSADAIRLANLEWLVKKIQLVYPADDSGRMAEADGAFGIIRQDTGAYLGTVGKLYKPFQNKEGFAFLDGVLEGFDARYESAGAIFYGGSKVWMLVHLPRQAFSLNGQDAIEAYAIFTNSHDGSSAARCFPTSQRVVCANTFRLAQKDADKGLTIRHTGSLEDRREKAQEALGLAVRGMDKFKESAKQLAATPVEPLPYFNGLLDAVCDVTQAQSLMGVDALAAALKVTEAEQQVKLAREIDKRKSLLDELLERYESETNGVGGMRGSGWSVFNSVTEAADHGRLGGLGGRRVGSKDDRNSRRFESIVNGDSDSVKQIAYEQVMQLVN